MLVGIDLGTTNSLITYFNGSEIEVVKNSFDESLTPSYIRIDGERLYVGKVAKESSLVNFSSTASSFKRNIGTKKVYNLSGRKFTSSELSSLVLKSLVSDFQERTGKEISEAIISVPAYFNDIQRKDTLVAAKLAGIKVKRLVNEPTAAAIAYGLTDKEDSKFLVFDLGGGTFDVSIVEVFEGVIEVRASGGDNRLGGDDFTQAIYEKFVVDVKASLGRFSRLSDKDLEYISQISDYCKFALTTLDSFSKHIVIKDIEIVLELSRDEFEVLVQPLISRIVASLKRVLNDSRLNPSQLDNVILVGGSTKIPMIKKLIARLFQKFPLSNINPDEVVGIGAGYLAEILSKSNANFQDTVVTDVTPFSLGVAIYDQQKSKSYFSPILDRNTIVPCSRVEEYFPISPKQTSVNIEIYQGESRNLCENVFIGKVEVPIATTPATEKKLLIRFTYDSSGVIEVIVKSEASNVEKKVYFEQNTESVNEEELKRTFEKLSRLKRHPKEVEYNIFIMERLNRLFEETLGDERAFISNLISEFEDALGTQDPEIIKKQVEYINAIISSPEQ